MFVRQGLSENDVDCPPGQREDGDAVIVESADPAASTRFLSSGNPALDGAVVGLGVGVLG